MTGSCLYSTGANDNHYLTASVTNFSSSAWSYAAWYYLDEVDNSQISVFDTSSPVGSNLGPSAHIQSPSDGGSLRFRIPYANVDGSSNQIYAQWRVAGFRSAYAGKWIHLAFTFLSAAASATEQDNPVLYINGLSQSWSTNSAAAAGGAASAYSFPAVPNSINKFWLFTEANVGNGWKGGIDEAMWYNTRLSASDIQSLYNCRVSNDISNPSSLPSSSYCKSWWTMGDHPSDPRPLSGTVNGISNDDTPIIDVMGNNNLMIQQGATPRLHWNIGMPRSASFATFRVTSSIESAAAIRTATLVNNSCSFGLIVNQDADSTTGIRGGVDPVTGDVRTSLDVVNTIITSSATNTIISSRFSAPGGIETSHAYLDVYAREYSVYNSLNYRNLSLRGSGSGESTTIRVNSDNNRREGLRTLLSRHCGKFGTDSQHGAVNSSTYDSEASLHKVHRNVGRRPTDTSTIPAPVFNEDHNNAHFSSLLPRSEFQYTWVTSSLGSSYSYKSGKQRIYGYADPDGVISSSVSIDGESGHVAAITFPSASEIFGGLYV